MFTHFSQVCCLLIGLQSMVRPGAVLEATLQRAEAEPVTLLSTSVSDFAETGSALPTAPSGHWIALRPAGKRSNRDAIGTLVRLDTTSGSQWNRVTTCVGFAGSSDKTVHFGLGTDPGITKIEIRWPSGTIQALQDPQPDTRPCLFEQ